jgi:DNA end-binding protein Ku
VNIPIRLFPAIRQKDIHFHLLHEADNSRLRRKMVCVTDKKEVAQKDMVRGFEIRPGQIVVIDDKELEAVAPKASRTVELLYFVDLVDVDPIYYEKPYYILPDEAATKAYELFVQALTRTKKVGIARFVMREKEHVATIRPVGNVLVLETMYFHDEIIFAEQVAPAGVNGRVSERELHVAEQLIASLSSQFHPERLKDEYRDAVLAMVRRKAAGKESLPAPEEEEETPQLEDLLSALQKSLAQAKGKKGAPARRKGT